ncbi:uncharacterized protein KY384_006137 [Bacidia gigantensis]|uniref:uncharacterized protein n=1 Tax=Bacidia gigantensis TaxID=2732470 RepID=UPI001D054E9D|nr:uncharacterized protein KY384_006137 [Bacidia gigantensis]KAG8529500.1 hypothetical protein KY384_006137 [Bacidia gigantensis]
MAADHPKLSADEDSRTTLGKRPKAQISTDNGVQVDSAQSAPRKRAKKETSQWLEDFDGSSSPRETTNPTAVSEVVPSRNRADDEKAAENGFNRPSPNYPSKIPVAFSPSDIPDLRDVIDLFPSKSESSKVKWPVKENKAYVTAFENLIKHNPKSTKDSDAFASRLAWYQYFPLCEKWFNPPPAKAREVAHGRTETKKARLRFWSLVENCKAEGTLLELRAGKFGGVEALREYAEDHKMEENLEDEADDLIKTSERFEMAVARRKQIPSVKVKAWGRACQKVHFTEVDLNYCKYYPSGLEYQPISTFKRPSFDVPDMTPSLNGSPAQLWRLVEKCMSDGNLQKLKDGQLSPEYVTQAATHLNADLDSSNNATNHQLNTELDSASLIETGDDSDKDEGGVAILTNAGLRIDRVTLSPNDNYGMSPIDQEARKERTEANQHLESDSQDSDEMHVYANSELVAPRASSRPQSPKIMLEEQQEFKLGVRILADLTPEDLNAQLRYFHLFKQANEVPGDALVRCLTCREAGHMAPDCVDLTCTHCGAFNVHASSKCNLVKKCTKCKEQGHVVAECPHKLKRVMTHELSCNLCKRNGHDEEDCELIWRTTGLPVSFDMPKADLNHLSCHECGKSGHLGNDCPSRRPGKAFGTTTWSLQKDTFIRRLDSAAPELRIRGRARQPPAQPAVISDENDQNNFYRSRQQKPSGRGQIRIKNNFANSQTLNSLQPISTSDGLNPSKKSNQSQSEAGYGHPRGSHDAPRQASNTNSQYISSPMSWNLQVQPQVDRYLPQQPSAQPYRPMPSAAQNAWSKYRS